MTKSGEHDATTIFLYDGHKIVETRLGGQSTFHQQFIHGTRYIDELVMMRVKKKGDLYVHQDANWNVIGVSDLGGRIVERYAYSPYGQVTVFQETGFGDRDGDGDVDSTDKGTVGTTCTGTVSGACRILDNTFDGTYGLVDALNFDSLPSGLQVRPGLAATKVTQPFARQGLLFEPEIGSYQNRARQYDPVKRRFIQRDPLCLKPVARSGYHDGLNLHAYLPDPLTTVDPSGLTGMCDQCATDSYGCDYYICRQGQTLNPDMQIYYQTSYLVCSNAPDSPSANAYRLCLQVCDQDDCPSGSCGLITSGLACHLGCL